MKKTLIAATGNADKLREFREIAEGSGLDIISMKEAGFCGDIKESGTSFEENALIKARAVWAVTGETVFADDSGLAVDALDGFPGIYSARFLGEDAPYTEKCAALNAMLDEKEIPMEDRTARFVCAMAVIFPDGKEETVLAEVEGLLIPEMTGEKGFGYDPVFYVPEFGATTAQMSEEQKNAISHRGKAFRKLLEHIV